jgi:peptidoglycan-associated lipoprotein
MSHIKSIILVMTSAVVLAACSSPTKLNDAPVVESKPQSVAPSADPRQVSTVNTASSDPLNDPQGVLAMRSVYFDFDSFVVRTSETSVVKNHSQYLNNNKQRKILIQGNTDDRGGAEYNLALGQKRAEAVRKSMTLLGVPESQMEAVSLGKEKPKAQGSNEAAWAENRRADIVY